MSSWAPLASNGHSHGHGRTNSASGGLNNNASSGGAGVAGVGAGAGGLGGPSLFEQQRSELMGEIGESLELVLQNVNKLNRSLEGIIAVGNEFSSVEALWSQFENVMAKDPDARAAGDGDDGDDDDDDNDNDDDNDDEEGGEGGRHARATDGDGERGAEGGGEGEAGSTARRS